MTTLREAAQQALEVEADRRRKALAAEMRAALAQQAEPDHETRAELAEQQVVQLAEERDHYRNLWQKAQQAEAVVRGAAYADALRWTIKACGAVQRDDGVWFGDDAAARLARVLSEGIATPQQAEAVALTHRHEWFRTGGMEQGQFRCIHCGAWVREKSDE